MIVQFYMDIKVPNLGVALFAVLIGASEGLLFRVTPQMIKEIVYVIDYLCAWPNLANIQLSAIIVLLQVDELQNDKLLWKGNQSVVILELWNAVEGTRNSLDLG